MSVEYNNKICITIKFVILVVFSSVCIFISAVTNSCHVLHQYQPTGNGNVRPSSQEVVVVVEGALAEEGKSEARGEQRSGPRLPAGRKPRASGSCAGAEGTNVRPAGHRSGTYAWEVRAGASAASPGLLCGLSDHRASGQVETCGHLPSSGSCPAATWEGETSHGAAPDRTCRMLPGRHVQNPITCLRPEPQK